MIDGKGLNRFAIIGVVAGGTAFAAQAETMTAGVVLKRMSGEQQATFVAGIIEGLAHAKYVKGNRDEEGRGCIYRWYYGDKANRDKIYEAFALYPDTLPGRIVGALVATKCGA